MRKLCLLFFLFLAISVLSQNKQILYNFTSIPQSLMINPGSDMKYNWFVGIPLLSGLSSNVGSTNLAAFDLFANNGIDFNDKLKEVIFSSTRKDKIAINQQLEIFSGGVKLGDWQKGSYLSFGMYQEMDFLTYIPKDYAIMALYGNNDYIGKVYDFGDLNTKGELLSVFHLGYHKNINEKLIVGLRGKIYSSIFNISSTHNSGDFYTIQDGNSYYEQVFNPDVLINTSGVANFADNGKSTIIKNAFLGGNLGLGLDVGATYYFKKNIQITASAIDIGFISHTKEVENYKYKGYYKNDGVNPDFILENGGGDILKEFNEAIPLDTLYTKYTTLRPMKFNSSIQYSFGNGKKSTCDCAGKESNYTNAIGAQIFVMPTPRSPFVAFTTYYRRKFFDSIDLKATYTLDSFSKKNIGLGVSNTFGMINFYLLADNLLEYKDISKANSVSFQFGFNIILQDTNTPD